MHFEVKYFSLSMQPLSVVMNSGDGPEEVGNLPLSFSDPIIAFISAIEYSSWNSIILSPTLLLRECLNSTLIMKVKTLQFSIVSNVHVLICRRK